MEATPSKALCRLSDRRVRPSWYGFDTFRQNWQPKRCGHPHNTGYIILRQKDRLENPFRVPNLSFYALFCDAPTISPGFQLFPVQHVQGVCLTGKIQLETQIVHA